MSNSVDIEQIKSKLYQKLLLSGWGNKLKTFILSDEFTQIIYSLVKDVNNGNKFTPPLKQIFTTFEECKYDNLKIVLCGMDPFPKFGAADGIAFSCSNLNKPEKSLQFIFNEINHTVYKSNNYAPNPDLRRWCHQGVLSINTALTTRVGKVGSHFDIWKPFTVFLWDIIENYPEKLHIVYLGKKAEEWSCYISDKHDKYFVSHPASATYQKYQSWDSKDLFNTINNKLEKKIIW
jgi:uracil-DNA glycosylase